MGSRGAAAHGAESGVHMLEGIRDLAPSIQARALEIEQARRIPTDLVARLRALGLFRMLVPRVFGGAGVAYPQSVEILMESAAADSSMGWTIMIGSHAPLLLGQFPRDTFESIYARSPDIVTAGSTAPGGSAQRTGHGYRVSGRWSFATGCQHADWIFGVCVEAGEGENGRAAPQFHMVLQPSSAWEIIDTWHAVGLKGSGSHDVVLPSTEIGPAHMTAVRATDPPAAPPARELGSSAEQKILHLAAVAVGIAEGALRELTAVARSGKRRLYSPQTLSENLLFQQQLGACDADVNAARAYLRAMAAEFWDFLQQSAVPESFVTRALQATAWIVQTCCRAVGACHRAAGSSAVYESSPLQRRLRDIHTLSQHLLVQEPYLAVAGALRLGLPALPFGP